MTTKILGHKKQIKWISEAIKQKNIPNAWLFFGSKGIGKALLAKKVAHLLASINFDNKGTIDNLSSQNLIDIDTKPDIRNIYYCRRQKEEKKDKKNKFIGIDDIRKMQKSFSLASVDGTYRTCIIDSAEDLNLQSSNALLKILEEPPEKTLFIIICNNMQSVIPTVASRCQKLQFHNLDESEMLELTGNFIEDSRIDTKKKEHLLKMSNGSPGKFFLFFAEDFFTVYLKIESIASDFPKFDYAKIYKLISEHPSYSTWEDMDRTILSVFLNFISDVACKLMESNSLDSKELDDILLKKLKEIPDIQLLIAHLYSQLVFLGSEAQKFNLDPKKIIFLSFSLFEKLEK